MMQAPETQAVGHEPLAYGRESGVPPWLRVVCIAAMVMAASRLTRSILQLNRYRQVEDLFGESSSLEWLLNPHSMLTIAGSMCLLLALAGSILGVAGWGRRTWLAAAGFAGAIVVDVASQIVFTWGFWGDEMVDGWWWVTLITSSVGTVATYGLLVILLAPPLRERLGLGAAAR